MFANEKPMVQSVSRDSRTCIMVNDNCHQNIQTVHADFEIYLIVIQQLELDHESQGSLRARVTPLDARPETKTLLTGSLLSEIANPFCRRSNCDEHGF
jgi:hypothetical protein